MNSGLQRNPLKELLCLDENLALMAGAGAGKTHNLIGMCLHLLAGARKGPAVPPARLCLLTFTDKAAGELRERLRARIEALARDGWKPTSEWELQETFAKLGRPLPERSFWRRVHDELGSTTVGTFHSLCLQILRQAPAGMGVDPSFELLDERQAHHLIREKAEELILYALKEEESSVVALCRELGFSGQGSRASGLVELLCRTYGKLREEGVSPSDLKLSDGPAARQAFEQALQEMRSMVSNARSSLTPKDAASFGETLALCAAGLEGLTAENFLAPERYPLLASVVTQAPQMGRTRSVKEIKFKLVGKDNSNEDSLADLFGAVAALPFEHAYKRLLVRLSEAHALELSRRRAMDFSELLIRTRNLLRDEPHFRADIQSRFGALLVDEFQDTNRLQLELVTLLAEQRQGAPRRDEVGRLPLEPGFLCAVGDRKQSIYEFRGADVAVFEILARKIEAGGGRRAFLQENWRSLPQLLQFFNGLFASLMRASDAPRDFQTSYLPQGDDLLPVRAPIQEGPPVEMLVWQAGERPKLGDVRQVEAEKIAQRLKALLSDGFEVIQKEGSARKGRGGDIAILFRRFTHLEIYRQALIRQGVPHRIVRGRGFYRSPEVLDVAALLALWADESDAIAFVTVLRSPWVGLSDDSLVHLAQACEGRLSLSAYLGKAAMRAIALPSDEAMRLERFLKMFRRLAAQKDRLSIRELLRLALEETQFRVSVAATAFAEQALANLDKLLDLAASWDDRAQGDGAAFARELRELSDREPTEAQADVLDATDDRAVALLTIHQSKGLEWPVVVLPDLLTGPRHEGQKIVFDRTLGLSLRPVNDEGIDMKPPHYKRVWAELKLRSEAESLRLLYVAMTRARDRLILSGAAPFEAESWWTRINRALEENPELGKWVDTQLYEEVEAPRALGTPTESGPERPALDIDETLRRVREKALFRPKTVSLPVTVLHDLMRCPRRFHYVHHLGLSELPRPLDFESPRELELDVRERGTLAHRLLELTSLEWVGKGTLRPELEKLLALEGLSRDTPEAREILEPVTRFWTSAFAGRVAARRGEVFERELPFMWAMESEKGFRLHVRGQIDLLWLDEEGTAWVVDYKFSRRSPSGLLPHCFQLACYAWAVRKWVGRPVPVRAGISFLKGDVEPEFLDTDALGLGALETELLDAVDTVLSLKMGDEWPGVPLSRCRETRCGFVKRCHPSS